MQIILGTEKKFAPLIGMLTGSSAYIAGQTIHIRMAENSMKLFINRDYLDTYVSEAARETLGQQYQIKLD